MASSRQAGVTLPSQTFTTPLVALSSYSSPLVAAAEYGSLNVHLKSDQNFTFELFWRNTGSEYSTSAGATEFAVNDNEDGTILQFPVAGTAFYYTITAGSTSQTSLLVSVFASYFPYFPDPTMSSPPPSELITDLSLGPAVPLHQSISPIVKGADLADTKHLSLIHI